jgi:hypothetical protein
MAEIIAIQQDIDFFAWIGMIQLAMQSKFLMQDTKRFKFMML